MFASIQRIIDRARFELPGATDATINLALFDAFDEWCRRTDANRKDINVALTAGTTVYSIVQANQDVLRVWDMKHNNSIVDADVDVIAGTITLRQSPTAADAATPLVVTISMSPKAGVDDPDDWMVESLWARHATVMIDGIIAKMASQIAKPYSNQTKAVFHGRRFHNGVAASKYQSGVNYLSEGRAWNFPIIR